ncbi:hypothetical protein EYR40_002796 [Pleurotus pulmonarius]|nr:hypothetical protein EYR36_012046 [Pleurotus pulmonarius]KAF4581778.1 hypothetical protein EYR40_002796 [Pleurotus pulmonarius]
MEIFKQLSLFTSCSTSSLPVSSFQITCLHATPGDPFALIGLAFADSGLSRARTTVRRKSSSGKAATDKGDQTTPPTSPVTIPPTPRATRVSPRKRELPADAPAVQMSPDVSAPALSRRLSFGSIESVEVIEAPASSQTVGGEAATDAMASDSEDVVIVSPLKVVGAKRRRESPASTPSPPPTPTRRVSKKPNMASQSARELRQANPAKRIRPIARLDSDDEGTVVVSLGSSEGNASEEDVDQLSPSTPKPAHTRRSAVLSMLDTEAEEAVDGDDEGDDEGDAEEGFEDVASAWVDDSPPPKPAGPSPLKAASSIAAKGKGKAKAVTFCEGTDSSKPKTRPTPTPITRKVTPPVVAAVYGSAADIFGDCGERDDAIFRMDSEDEHFPARSRHEELLDETLFAVYPPLIRDIIVYLRAKGITQNLQPSELRSRYNAQSDDDGKLPSLLFVMARLTSKDAMVPIFDSLLFRGSGIYMNPFTSNPRDFCLNAKRVLFSSGPYKGRAPIFVMPVIVHRCNLLSPVHVNDNVSSKHLRLTGWVFGELFEHFSAFIGSIFNLNYVYAYMESSRFQFSSRSTPKESAPSAPSTPQNSARHSLAFASPSQRTPRSRSSIEAPVPKFSHSLGPEDTIPVYDGRPQAGNFGFDDKHWRNLSKMPRLGVPPPAAGKEPDNKLAVEILPFEPHRFCVALVGFTLGAFNPGDLPTETQVSFNLQFAILIGSYVYKKVGHEVSLKQISELRAAAARGS